MKTLPAEPFKISQQNLKVIDLLILIKVGRNDPCPCVSGKRYMKCYEK
ncbi:SEC-C metal-binding domain-containing protein [Desulfosporosinus fructosivorans]